MTNSEKSFEQAEANARLSRADPSGDPHYENIRARMIAGELTEEEARKEIIAFHKTAASNANFRAREK